MRTTSAKHLCLILLLGASTALAQGDAPVRDEVPLPPPPPAATAARAGKVPPLSTDSGWNSSWALLFSINNFFNSGSWLSGPVSGSVGANYFLSEESAVRVGFSASRQHNPAQVTRNDVVIGPDTVTTYTFSAPGFTEFHSVNLRGEYLKRLGKGQVAPFIGAGADVGWNWTRSNFVDDVSVVEQRREVENHTSNVMLNARGILGAEWRLHPNFALFAEYNVTVTLVGVNRVHNRTALESTLGGTTTSTTTTAHRMTVSYLQLSTGLAQGATMGLQVFFN